MKLLSYQKKWLADDSRFKIGLMSRQIGKTFICTLELVLDILKAEEKGRKVRWLILSRGERQSREALAMVRNHIAVLQLKMPIQIDTNNASEISFPKGSRLTALPASPDTVRGFSGGCLLDEFSFHPDADAIWKAVFPVISAGHKIRVISTPNGKSNKFYELVQLAKDPQSVWSLHKTTVHDAVQAGLPRNIKELRAGLADEIAWEQEYELKWLDESHAWLSYDLIDSCSTEEELPYNDSFVYLGYDVSRKNDLSVVSVLEWQKDKLVLIEMLSFKSSSFEYQFEMIDDLFKRYKVRKMIVDSGGMGVKVTEDLQRLYGKRVEGLVFTNKSKHDLVIGIKQAFEDNKIRIPDDKELRKDLHSVERVTTASGLVRFEAPHTVAGHGDRFWSLALAIWGSDAAGLKLYEYESMEQTAAGRGFF